MASPCTSFLSSLTFTYRSSIILVVEPPSALRCLSAQPAPNRHQCRQNSAPRAMLTSQLCRLRGALYPSPPFLGLPLSPLRQFVSRAADVLWLLSTEPAPVAVSMNILHDEPPDDEVYKG
ncbi:uncharacterized protein LOC144700661 isoform X2 [Wolffia australiana]